MDHVKENNARTGYNPFRRVLIAVRQARFGKSFLR